jgi:hypothetical protein
MGSHQVRRKDKKRDRGVLASWLDTKELVGRLYAQISPTYNSLILSIFFVNFYIIK